MHQTLVIVTGLALAAWGHMLVHDLLGAARAWRRVDDLFPVVLRSAPAFAGRVMLLAGSVLVMAAMFG